VAVVNFAYQTCPRCNGERYQPFIGPLFIVCRKCKGTGERQRAAFRIFNLLRHGAAAGEDY
jgi:DnaJ-class molecular chaperone